VAAFERPATYWHALPEYSQARKALWAAVNPHTGKRRIDEAFPHEIRETTNEQEMFIRFKNGSTWQLVGSDRYNSLVGAGVAGVTFSEWALCNPSAWGYIRPMMEENDGWAAFITTPRGRNHAKAMYDMGMSNPKWFAQCLSISETGALTPEQLDDSIAEYISLYGEDLGRAQFEQEYLCSFNAAILGAFYAREMVAVRKEGRISEIHPIPNRPVHTAWDIGVRDDTSIWWFQVVGGQVFILDCYSASGAGVDHYADICHQKPWQRGRDFVPHDAKVKEWGTGRTRVETMQSMGLNPFLVPGASKLDGINAVRRTLPRCVFHPRCEDVGISALEQYRREWDDERKCFKASEVHDWCFVGETEIATRYGMCQIRDLPETGEVLTPCGWKRYIHPRITRKNARLVAVEFADGLTVRCTPDHLFMTDSGWISAECLVKGSLIQSCLTPSRSISMALSTASTRAIDISRKVVRGFTETFGKTHLAQSLMGAISTIGMTTQPITRSGIWNACRLKTTCRRPLQADAAEGGNLSSINLHESVRRIGIGLKRVVFGTADRQKKANPGQSGNEKKSRASIAERCFMRLFGRAIHRNIAPRTAKWQTIESVKPLERSEDVWCITVPGVEAFALSNGAVVHNCSHLSDAFRYLSLSWKQAPTERDEPKVAQPRGTVVIGPPEPQSKKRIVI